MRECFISLAELDAEKLCRAKKKVKDEQPEMRVLELDDIKQDVAVLKEKKKVENKLIDWAYS